MKTTLLIAVFAFAFAFGNVFSQSGNQNQAEISEIKAMGECGMCKARIEKAAMTDGVLSAIWNKDTKMLKIEYLPSKIRIEAIHMNIAKAGHDTDKEKADDAVYNKLPACCKYERMMYYQDVNEKK